MTNNRILPFARNLDTLGLKYDFKSYESTYLKGVRHFAVVPEDWFFHDYQKLKELLISGHHILVLLRDNGLKDVATKFLNTPTYINKIDKFSFTLSVTTSKLSDEDVASIYLSLAAQIGIDCSSAFGDATLTRLPGVIPYSNVVVFER
jgi:hypothetical protein